MEDMTILETVKDMIGPSIDYDVFDKTLLIHINSFFEVLTQCGIGPEDGFKVDENTTWDDFITTGVTNKLFDMAKDYIQICTRLVFDPPTSSTAVDILTQTYKEMEWRMFVEADSNKRLNGF
jgi:hypothetical protein